MVEEIAKIERLEIDEAHIVQPSSTDEIDKHVWMQILSMVEVSAMSKGTKFCDEFGYDYTQIYFMKIKTQIGHSTTKTLGSQGPMVLMVNLQRSCMIH